MNNKNSKRRLIPCPSEYKRLTGNHYHNEHQINSKTYFTHSTIHRMPGNAMYTGIMKQCRAPQAGMYGQPKNWAPVSGC